MSDLVDAKIGDIFVYKNNEWEVVEFNPFPTFILKCVNFRTITKTINPKSPWAAEWKAKETSDNNQSKITPEELKDLLGTEIPIVVIDLLFNGPENRPIGEIRNELFNLSRKVKTAFRNTDGNLVSRNDLIKWVRNVLLEGAKGDFWASAFDYILSTDETSY